MTKPNSDIADLHPMMREPVRNLIAELHGKVWTGEDGQTYCWALFEGYRPPEVQQELLETTHSTKVGPWHSAHQFGLAVDIVPCIADARRLPTLKGWNWSEKHPWPEMHSAAQRCGLKTPIAWDQPHVQHPAWSTVIPHGR